MRHTPVIAIIGAGFAGSMLAVQLATRSHTPFTIELYDAKHAFARGVAYGTTEPHHLLNVAAGKMGAFDDNHGDFYRWAVEHEAQWRARHPDLKDTIIAAEHFLPRMLYGDYIEHLLHEARQGGRVHIERIKAEVTDIAWTGNSFTLTLADGTMSKADRVTLALGNLPAASFRFTKGLAGSPRYTAHIWAPESGSLLAHASLTEEKGPICIIGTGLTTIDAMLTLRAKGYGGEIIAVSRHGLLPQPHKQPLPVYPRFLAAADAPGTALGLLHAIRSRVKQAKKDGADWRAVVDSLRPDTQALWQKLPPQERKKLLRVLSYWGVHRHRIPPQAAAMLEKEIGARGLTVISGHILDVQETHEGLHIDIRRRNGERHAFTAAHLLNCSGPDSTITRASHALLQNLLRREIIMPGPLGMGIAADVDYRVQGVASSHLFALGPLLAGERLETIAVPELRTQAEAVAKALLGSF